MDKEILEQFENLIYETLSASDDVITFFENNADVIETNDYIGEKEAFCEFLANQAAILLQQYFGK